MENGDVGGQWREVSWGADWDQEGNHEGHFIQFYWMFQYGRWFWEHDGSLSHCKCFMQSWVKQYGTELLWFCSSKWQSHFPFAYVPWKGAFSRQKQLCMYFLPKRTLLVFSKKFGISRCLSTVISRYISKFQTVSETIPCFSLEMCIAVSYFLNPFKHCEILSTIKSDAFEIFSLAEVCIFHWCERYFVYMGESWGRTFNSKITLFKKQCCKPP